MQALPAHRWTIADRLVSYLDPARGLQRRRSRVAEALAGGYHGGSRTRRQTQNWLAGSGSANADTLPDLPELRARSRDLVRNAPLATGAVNTVCTNVVGTGLAVQPRIDREFLGISEDQARAWSAAAKREFRLWASSVNCDATRTQNFYGLQDLVFRSALENGDVFALTPQLERPGSVYKLALQLIEADRVCDPSGRADGVFIAGGVELDGFGGPLAYHVMRTHPGELGVQKREWDRVGAFGEQTGRRNVLHLYTRLRIGQTRGVPYLAPILEPMKQLDRYTEAEVMAAVVTSLFTVFVHSKDGAEINAPLERAETDRGSAYDPASFKLGSGAVLSLADDDQVSFANPLRPNTAFDPFVQAVLRQMGVALELPFEVLVKHFTASYSAARAALLDAWKFFRTRRSWLADNFCQPVYELLIDEAVARGRLAAPGYFRDPAVRAAYIAAEWVGDGPGAIDPLKEAEAIEKRIDIGVTTLEKETMAYDGGNWEDNTAQQLREQAARAELKPAVQTSAPVAAAPDNSGSDAELPDTAARGARKGAA